MLTASLPRVSSVVLVLGVVGCLAPAPIRAQEEEHAEHAEDQSHAGGHHGYKNELALMLGGTWEREEDEVFFTGGIEYLRVLNERWGIELVAERISDIDALVFVVPAKVRPSLSSEFHITFGPGFENKTRRPGGHGDGHAPPDPTEVGKEENLFLWRTGVGYGFHFGKRMVLTPAVDLDLIREGGKWQQAVVFDVAIGFAF